MKTKEQLAEEYVSKHFVCRLSNNVTKQDYLAGFTEAERFIPVTEALPENYYCEHGSQFGIDILVICPNRKKYLVDRKFSVDHNEHVWRYKDGGRVHEVVSWRPINKV